MIDSNKSLVISFENYFFEPDLVYYRMRQYTFPRVFPHAGIHISACISACGNQQKNVYSRTFFPAEIHKSACKLTCGNSPSRSNFRMWKYTKKCVFPHVGKFTIFGVFPHAEIHDLMWISTCGNAYFRGADLHILLCISTCGNSLKTVQIRVRGNTLFLMWTFTLNCVYPHAVIHQKMCKSAQRIYTFLGTFPQVEIHNYKCKSSYAENQSLVNFLVLGNTPFLVYIRMG